MSLGYNYFPFLTREGLAAVLFSRNISMSTDRPNRQLRFDEVAEIYDRARPEYPKEAFREVFHYLRLEQPVGTPAVVEIGPGTGQATKALIALGARVTAVELGPRLAQFMREKFASEKSLHVITGAFEDVDLAQRRYDIVFAATAFHWLDPNVRLRKAVELLAPGGVIATLSTIQIQSEVDRGYFERSHAIYKRYRPDEQHSELPTEKDAIPSDYEEFRSSGLLDDVIVRRYRWDQTYTTDTYEQLVRSYSDTQMMDAAAREGLLADLRDVIKREFGGKVTRPLVIALTLGRLREGR